MRIIFSLVIYIVFLTAEYFPQYNYGLLFSGNYGQDVYYRTPARVNAGYKTGLNLTAKKPLILINKISISFSFAFWSVRNYGAIIRGYDDEHNFRFELYSNYFTSPDSLTIELLINSKSSGLKTSFPKNLLNRINWINASLEFDIIDNNITCSFNGKMMTAKYGLPRQLALSLEVGSTTIMYECPRIAMRDIEVKDGSGKLLHLWRLDEFSGNVAKDAIGGLDAVVKNGEWLLQKSYKWDKVSEFTTAKVFSPGVIYNEDDNCVYISDSSRIFIYNSLTDSTRFINLSESFPFKNNRLIYDNYNKRLISYYRGEMSVRTLDEKKRAWSRADTSKDFDTDYYISEGFINPVNGDFVMTGGYGWYAVKNHFRKFNFVKNEWEMIETKGDFLPPRFQHAVGLDKEGARAFIFGGYGSESGKQEFGFKRVFDLYQIDLRDYTIKRLWKKEKYVHRYGYVKQLAYCGGDSLLALGMDFKYLNEEPEIFFNDSVYLFLLNLNKPEWTKINSFPNPSKEDAPVYFFYSRDTKELYYVSALNKGNKTVYSIYRMSYPPASSAQIAKWSNKNLSVSDLYIYLSAALLVIIVISAAVYYISKKSRKKRNDAAGLPKKDEIKPASSIRLFGQFTVYDKKGKDITSLFHPKLKQLFLLFIIYSKRNGTAPGISSEKLSAILWQDSDAVQVKNNRNAAISRLRKTCSGIGDVRIEFTDAKWIIKLDDSVNCDFYKYSALTKDLKDDDNGGIFLSYLKVIGQGPFLEDTDYEWLDPLKSDILLSTVDICIKELRLGRYSDNPEIASEIAGTVLRWDAINEEALQYKISALNKLDRMTEIISLYDTFCLNYKMILEKEFPSSLKELLDKEKF